MSAVWLSVLRVAHPIEYCKAFCGILPLVIEAPIASATSATGKGSLGHLIAAQSRSGSAGGSLPHQHPWSPQSRASQTRPVQHPILASGPAISLKLPRHFMCHRIGWSKGCILGSLAQRGLLDALPAFWHRKCSVGSSLHRQGSYIKPLSMLLKQS